MNEKEINIVDLIVEMLLHWRMFIICIIAGAAAFGVVGYVRSGKDAQQKQMQNEKIMLEPEKWLTEEGIQNVNYVINYEKLYLAKTTYLEKSPLMQLDFNNASKAEATLAVVAETHQESCDIARVYKDIVESGELIIKVAEDTGIETGGIGEMLFLDRMGAYGTYDISVNTQGVVSRRELPDDCEEMTFKIAALHSNEEKCKEMLECALAFLKEKQPAISRAMGEHEITVVNESFGVITDMDIADLQKLVLSDIANMKKTISAAKDELTDAEKKYYTFLTTNDAEKETVLPTEISLQKINVKYIFWGAVIAAFLYAIVLLILYVLNTKIRVTDSIQELYGIPQLGMIPREKGHKRIGGVIDEWILSLQNHNKRQFNSEEALELAAIAIKMVSGKETLQEVYLIGCDLKDRAFNVCEKIKERLKGEGIQINILNNILYNAQMMEELGKAKGVVLVESADSTLYNEITEELELLKRQEIKILGGILIG